MKRKDLGVIIGVAIVSGIISLIVSSKVIVTPAHRQQQVEVVPAINAQFSTPSTTYFNSQSIDPTVLIQIGNNSNQTPFNNSPQ